MDVRRAIVVATSAYALGMAAQTTFVFLHAGLLRDVGDRGRARALRAISLAWNLPWAAGAVLGGLLRQPLDGWLFVLGAGVVALGPAVGLWLRHQARVRRSRPPAIAGST